MKRTYKKPIVLMETFSVTEMVAAGCGAKVTLLDPNQGCSSSNYFIQDAFDIGHFLDTCMLPLTADKYEGICYQGPPDNAVFHS